MIQITPFAIAGLFAAITHLCLTYLLLRFGRQKVHQIYSLCTISILIWGMSSFFIGSLKDQIVLLFVWKVGYTAVIFIPVFFLHTTLELLNIRSSTILRLSYLQALIFTFLIAANKSVNQLYLAFNSIYYVNADTYFLLSFIIWFLQIIYVNIIMISNLQLLPPEKQLPLRFYFYSNVCGFLGGLTNFLPCFKFDIYPYGNFLIPFHTFFMTYAFFRYQLMDLRLIFLKSFVYSFLVALLTLIYFCFILIFEKLFKDVLGYQSFFISFFSAITIATLFIPLKNRIQSFVDRHFFKGTQVEIAEQNELLRQELARSEKLKAVATLASGMAHEIKNPLTALKTFSEYLPEKKNDPEFLDKFSKIVGSEVDRIDSLVHQLLEFAKPSPPVLKDTDIHQLIEDTLNLLSNQLLKHKITVNKDFNADGRESNADGRGCDIRENPRAIRENPRLLIKIDPNQIRQALLNIFLNAIEAMGNGGNLTVKTRVQGLGDRVETKPYNLPPNTFLVVSISDTGSGISPKDLPHIFDPFFSKKDHGTGLGLAITYQIIDEHKGKIAVKSEVGKGAEFVIELPLQGIG